MGAPTTAERLIELADDLRREMDETEALREALKACLPFAEMVKDGARDERKFKAARSAYRMGCAALGIEHD